MDDETFAKPFRYTGQAVYMEQLYETAFPGGVLIVRPTGIYSGSSARMQKLGRDNKKLSEYPLVQPYSH